MEADYKSGKAAGTVASVQFYIADDFIRLGAFVNKRIPLTVVDVGKECSEAVFARLSDLYGADKLVAVSDAAGERAVRPVAELSGEYASVEVPAESMTEHKRFDFSDLVEIMKRLRGEGGCEWDRAQTHSSIRINLIEEAYELVEAIDCGDPGMLLEESGDVLMQAVFHTEMAEEAGEFNFTDMLTALCSKLLERHTHIFGSNHADNAEQALNFWNEAKKKEKKYKSDGDAMDRVPKNLPALLYAEKIQKIAKKSGFDWGDVAPAAAKIGEELEELLSADEAHRAEEGGDLLFAVVNVLRFLKVEPETALREANAKFLRRFKEVERRVTADGRRMRDCALSELDAVWDKVKRSETDGQ